MGEEGDGTGKGTGQEAPKNSRTRTLALAIGVAAAILVALQLQGNYLPRQAHFLILFLAGAALALWLEAITKKRKK